ncbi:hypothetical protein D3C79_847580 [compost metagenome]
MIVLWALRRMPQAFAHCLQALDPCIDFVRFGNQHLPIDLQGRQHRTHFIQGKACGLPQRNQCQAVRHVGSELAPLTAPGEGFEQAFLFVIAQR